MGINVQFTAADWERIERDWSAWWAGELHRPVVFIETVDPAAGAMIPAVEDDLDRFASNFPLEMPVDEVLDFYQARLEATRFHGDAWPRWWPNFGPGIVAGFLGARVQTAPGTVWFEPAGQRAIQDLCPAYDADNVWWRRVRDLTARAVARWGTRVSVGHTDLGGNLDILASLHTTQQLLFELYDAPDEVARLAGEITRLWLDYYDALDAVIQESGRGTTPWAAIWSPQRCYMLQSDFCYMISPAMFEQFVLPDIVACCDALDHGFYHLDGKGQIPHLDMLLSLERLRGVQWIPGDGAPPPEGWLPLLKRIRDGGKLCQVVVDGPGALTITRELGGRGFAFWIREGMSFDDAEDLVQALADESGEG